MPIIKINQTLDGSEVLENAACIDGDASSVHQTPVPKAPQCDEEIVRPLIGPRKPF